MAYLRRRRTSELVHLKMDIFCSEDSHEEPEVFEDSRVRSVVAFRRRRRASTPSRSGGPACFVLWRPRRGRL